MSPHYSPADSELAAETAESMFSPEDRDWLESCAQAQAAYRDQHGAPISNQQFAQEVAYITTHVPHGAHIFLRFLDINAKILESGGDGAFIQKYI